MKWLLLLVLAGTCYAANGFVQIASCNQQAGATSCTFTFGSNTTAGNTIIVLKQNATVAYGQGAGLIPTLAGSFCYSLRSADANLNQTPTNGVYLDSWICPNIAGGTTTGPAINAGQASTSFTGFALEFSGLGTWPVFDQAPTTWPVFGNAGGYGSCVSSCTTTMTASATTTTGSLLIAYGGQQITGPATTCTAGSGFTLPSGGQVTSSTSIACVEYNLSSGGGSTTANMTVNTGQAYSMGFISLTSGSTPYLTNQPGPPNGFFITNGTVTAVPSHAAATITEAFPTMDIAPNGDVLMAYEQNSAGQGSGPNSAAALRFATAASCTTTCSWSDYAGTNYGTDCAGHPWFNGCLFSGDGANSDSHWFPGYNGLQHNGTKYYYQVTVESNVPACVKASLSISTTPETSWPAPTDIDTNSACWISPLIFVNNSTSNANCLNGCIIGVVQENGTNKLLFSTDGGNTFPNSVTINNGSIIFNQLEVFMWYNGGTQLLGVARSVSQQSYRFFSSPDLGTTWTGRYTNILTGGTLNSSWTLTSPVVLFPALGDGNISLLFTDRGNTTTRVTNASISTLLNSPQTISQGQTLNYGAGNSGGNTFGYPTAVPLGSNQWLFAWYAANASNNGQMFTVLGTYVPSIYAPFVIHR